MPTGIAVVLCPDGSKNWAMMSSFDRVTPASMMLGWETDVPKLPANADTGAPLTMRRPVEEPKAPLPSKNSTVPVGVPLPGLFDETVAVRVTLSPTTALASDDLTVVVVGSRLTVCVTTFEVLVSKVLLPVLRVYRAAGAGERCAVARADRT